MAQQKTQIEYVPVDDLKAYERNARTHSDEQIKQVAESIKEFGFTNPVLIDEHNELIAGHGRTLAAKPEQWSSILVTATSSSSVGRT